MTAIYLGGAVLAACMGQFILRIRPPVDGLRVALPYFVASLLCYGASFGITALVLPSVDRKIAVLILSAQYPLLYVLFSMEDSASLSVQSILAIVLGYAVVALGMYGR